jgi:hypothetical protein
MERKCREIPKGWKLLTGDKNRRIETDGGEQLGRWLSCLVSGVTEEEQEGGKILYLFTATLRVTESFMRS